MGPESVLGTIAGAIISRVELQTLFVVGIIAIIWWIYRDFIWSKVR